MLPWQSVDFTKRIIYLLRVERLPPGEERILVAEVAAVRASTRDNDGIGNKVKTPLDEIPPHRRHSLQRTRHRPVQFLRHTTPVVRQKAWPSVLPRPNKDGVPVLRGLKGHRGYMQATQAHMHAATSVVVCDLIGSIRRSDVHLDNYQVGRIFEIHHFHMLVLNPHLVTRIQVPGQCRQPQRREQRVLDRPPERALCLRKRRQYHFHSHSTTSVRTANRMTTARSNAIQDPGSSPSNPSHFP